MFRPIRLVPQDLVVTSLHAISRLDSQNSLVQNESEESARREHAAVLSGCCHYTIYKILEKVNPYFSELYGNAKSLLFGSRALEPVFWEEPVS